MIETLVYNLPEIYQPIFGHPGLSAKVSRPSNDRLDEIVRIHDALQFTLGRPLKVLDLGCAQGFFSLSLAARGATTHGVDFLEANIAVCNVLAKEQLHSRASFEFGKVEEVIRQLKNDQYDLVLGLSVFHHLIYAEGIPAVKDLLKHLATQSGVLITEMALQEEPLYWGPSQPQDPRELLESLAFVYEIARYGTHLADIPRPLFVASDKFWVLADKAVEFSNWSTNPHALAEGTHKGSRRYYFAEHAILKMYRFDHEVGVRNRTEHENEVRFLQSPPNGFPVPVLIDCGASGTEGWLVTERLPGKLILDLIREGAEIDHYSVLLAVLAQLATLEQSGLYHDDVRTWNVLVADSGVVHVIDYGSISTNPQDCSWPGNIFLAFLIFVQEIVRGNVDNPRMLRLISISPFGLPAPYDDWAIKWWTNSTSNWTFENLYQSLITMPKGGFAPSIRLQNNVWMGAIEAALQHQKLTENHHWYLINENLSTKFDTLQLMLQSKEEALRKIDGILDAQKVLISSVARDLSEVRISQLQLRMENLESNWIQLSQNSNNLVAECRALRNSWSWRVTAPARWVLDIAKKPKATIKSAANILLASTINMLQHPLSIVIAAVLRNPGLSEKLNHWLLQYPSLHRHLVQISRNQGVKNLNEQMPASIGEIDSSIDGLSPRARQIHSELVQPAQINQKNEGNDAHRH